MGVDQTTLRVRCYHPNGGRDVRWGRFKLRPQSTEGDLVTQLDVLQGISHAFGSAVDLEEAMGSTVRWIDATLGGQAGAIRVFLLDETERLRVEAAAAVSPAPPASERSEAAGTAAAVTTTTAAARAAAAGTAAPNAP